MANTTYVLYTTLYKRTKSHCMALSSKKQILGVKKSER